MKTITKEFWLSDEDHSLLSETYAKSIILRTGDESHIQGIRNPAKHKITISFEVPEKRITISESEFDMAIEDLTKNNIQSWSCLKQKLFGDEK